ncbi:hypothetical protein C8Q73DRAFT_796345, partial [Cubamyces lactineus]
MSTCSYCDQASHQNHGDPAKINVCDGELDNFLDLFAPSSVPCPLDPPSEQIAVDFVPLKGKEVHHYDPLVGLSMSRNFWQGTHSLVDHHIQPIVAGFPKAKRLSFCNTHSKEFPFPFSAFAEHHHKSKPDIYITFPGEKPPLKTESLIGLVCHGDGTKSTAQEDAFDTKAGILRTDAIVQLAIGASYLMLAHGLLAAYTIGIYGDMIRIARFDHACAVAER